MNYEQMGELTEGVFDQIRELRSTKGREYAGDEDTLADFKEVAQEAGTTDLQTWLVYVKKHQRAIDTFVREGQVKSESIESRVVDVITYHLLLLGLIEDRKHAALGEPHGPIGVAWTAEKEKQSLAEFAQKMNALRPTTFPEDDGMR